MAQPASLPSSWAVYVQDLSGGQVMNENLLREYAEPDAAFEFAKASAQMKQTTIKQLNPFQVIDLYPEPSKRQAKISVDYNMRLNYVVKRISEEASSNDQKNQQTHLLATDDSQGERQNTPAAPDAQSSLSATPPGASHGDSTSNETERGSDTSINQSPFAPQLNNGLKSSEALMHIKQEYDVSSNAPLHGYPTPAPKDDIVNSGQQKSGTDQVPIVVADEAPATFQNNEETMSGVDSFFNNSHYQRENLGGKAPVTERIESRADANKSLNTEDFGAALPAVAKEPTTIVAFENISYPAEQAEPKVDPTKAEPQVQTDYGNNNFGIYVTISSPPEPETTYRIQLNTSLGEAESDIKVMIGNELTRAMAKDIADDMHLMINGNVLHLVNSKKDSRLFYEIHKGEFVDGRFLSAVELAGCVTDGESYTKQKMKEILVTIPQKSGDEMDLDAPVAEDELASNEEELVSDTPTPIPAEVSGPSAANTSRKRSRVPEAEADLEGASQNVVDEEETEVVSPGKKRRFEPAETVQYYDPVKEDQTNETVETTEATEITEVTEQQSIPATLTSKKRDREAEQEAHEDLGERSTKKAKTGLEEDAEGESDDEATVYPPAGEANVHQPVVEADIHQSVVGANAQPVEDSVQPAMETAVQSSIVEVDAQPAAEPHAQPTAEEDVQPAVEGNIYEDRFCRCQELDGDGRRLFGCDGEQCPNNGWVHIECFKEWMIEMPEDDDEKWYCPDCDPSAFKKKGVTLKKKAGGKKVGGKTVGGKKGKAGASRKR